MEITAWVVIALIGIVGLGIWWHFSLRRRIGVKMHEVQPEERQALMDIQRDIGRGKAARQDFLFWAPVSELISSHRLGVASIVNRLQ